MTEGVETVARAIADASSPYDPRDWGDYLRDAAAAIAADPSPAEEAVKRVEALADRYRRTGATDVAAAIRAALASPAPAAQDETPLERQHRVASQRLSQIPEAYR